VNVLYVYQGDWPRNATRPIKQTKALSAAGHRVHLLSGNPQGKPRLTTEAWLSIERLPSFGSPRLHRVFGFPIFVNPIWIVAIFMAARRCKADCIIVVDLPIAAAAVLVGRLLGVPVHFDVADVYPVGMRDSRMEHPGLVGRITRNPRIAEAIERFVISRVATVFAVSTESRDRFLQIGVPADRVVIVGNTPENLDELARPYPLPAEIADWEGRPYMLFVGNLLPSRGLPYAVEASDIVRRQIPAFAFVIVGDGREEPILHSMIKERGLEQHVRLVGWKPMDEHPAYYANAAIGVLPFLPTQHISITLANKLFDYMGASLPVLATDVPPMRRVLEETQAGVLVPPKDPVALAQAIVGLVCDPGLRQRLGIAGRRAVEGKYSWAEDRRRFLDAIVASNHTGA
jgi:glycosyltransferase involved in cell wall biosynthesis